MKCTKCGGKVDVIKTKTSESWFCYNCNHGVIKVYKLRSIIWNFLYGLKYFFMDFRTVMRVAKQNLQKMSHNGNLG